MSDKIIAVSAGHEITEDELNDLIHNYPPEQQVYMSDPHARKQVMEQLIAFHLFHKMAVEDKITESKEYEELVEKVKVELASHMAATQIVEGIQVEEAEEKTFYEENPDLFAAQAQVSAKHILVDEEETANNIAGEIAQGLAFEEAAEKYSTCPSKEKGGDLGYFSKGQMVPEFEKAAFAGEIGTVIGPVQTQFGYHLILVEDKKGGTVVPFEQAQAQIHQQLIQSKQQEAYNAKIKELETKYGVERKEA
ncbi:MAG: peptidylprolyl isomerase [Lachnospiraceae bacterium]